MGRNKSSTNGLVEISKARALLFRYLRDYPHAWISAIELAEVTGLHLTSVHRNFRLLVQHGLVEERRVYPRYKFRLRPDAEQDELYQRLVEACEMFDI